MAVNRNRTSRALIMIMMAVVLVGALIAKVYYSNANNSADPRVKPARELYGKYNSLAQENNFHAIFSLLDSVEAIYSGILHYRDSYETGVLWNNRAAAWITLNIYRDSLTEMQGSEFSQISKDSLLQLAEESSRKSIDIYSNWKSRFAGKNKDEIARLIRDEFLPGLEGTEKELERYLNARVKEIEEAQWETERRLSVAYTNLGIVFRHKQQLEEAARMYAKAIELWEDNLSAENNLNRLLGRPERKRSIIQKLFPKSKETKKDKNK